MCKWCDKNIERKTGESYIGEGAEYCIDYDDNNIPHLYVLAYAQAGYDAGVANIPISYCPMCGRKLN